MNYMIILVLHDTETLDPVLSAWEESGVGGVTILPSTGLARLRRRGGLAEDLPLIPSIEDIMEHIQDTNRTLFTVVAGEEMVDRVKRATESITGPLDDPDTGIMIVLPTYAVYGLNRRDKTQ